MITSEQKARRAKGIFASDAAFIMTGKGVEIALQKLGEIEAPDLDDVPSVMLGNVLEAPVLDAYEREVGHSIIRSPDTILHPQFSWFGCHMDGLNEAQNRVVEAKAYSAFNRAGWGTPGTDEVPVERLWQCMAQMACTGAVSADIPITFVNEKVLVEFLTKGTVPVEIYTIQRNDELIDYMLDECGKVWASIEAGELPVPVNVGDAELIYRKASKGKVTEANSEIKALYSELMHYRVDLRRAEEGKAKYESLIKAYMADAEELRFGGKLLATWKNNKDGVSFDKDAFAQAYPDLYKQFTKPKAGARPFLFKE